MKFTFLAAADGVPLAKSFVLDKLSNPPILVKTAYPNAYLLDSYEAACATLPEFASALIAHAKAGHCLLKGNTTRPLIGESRAGATDRDALTSWICFDLDGAPFQTPDHFLSSIGLADVSYVLQWSASQGIDPTQTATGLRCHIFMWLDQPKNPHILKNWLQYLNLTNLPLRNATSLTATNCALRWPLDVSTCQNDKLLYIAPPTLSGIADPFPGSPGSPNSRIQYIKRAKETFSPASLTAATTAHVRSITDTRINELRSAVGMNKRRSTEFKILNGIEYLPKPEAGTITVAKVERGFVYLNVNDGDSCAYYHPEKNPDFIFNFKGEPVYKTDELDPAYWRSARGRMNANNPRIFFAFREFNSAGYYNGYYDQDNDDLVIAPAKSEKQLRDFAYNNNFGLAEAIEDWEMVFDPHDDTTVNLAARRINTFRRSALMKQDHATNVVTTCPPTCAYIIDHVLGNDAAVTDHFHNWMATVLNTKDRALTGWILHGTQGTGKGTLIEHMLRPIFGGENIASVTMDRLEENFTGFIRDKLMVIFDEIQTSSSKQQSRVLSRLKNLMTETHVSVREMYKDARMVRNYANFLFTSNMPTPVEIPADDRRFNVGGYQNNKLNITEADIVAVQGEIWDLYCFWMHYPYDPERAKTPLKTAARTALIETSMQTADRVAQALNEGDLEFFIDQLPISLLDTAHLGANVIAALGPKEIRAAAYRDLMRAIVQQPGGPQRNLHRDDVLLIFNYCVGNVPDTPTKFTQFLKHHRIHIAPISINGKTSRGLAIKWNCTPARLAQLQQDLA